jgi:hypothetical protein
MVVRDSFTVTEITVMNDRPPQDAESIISILHNTFKKVLCFNGSHALKENLLFQYVNI